MLTDIEIAQQAKIKPISEIAAKLGYGADELEAYGKYKAKIPYDSYGDSQAKLVLVTAVNPTPLGEGKTTMSIGLADGLNKLDRNAVLCLREPSLGPVFGVKGGAAGGGYSQVIPMEDINLHFTGDLHAIECANNLLAAMIDNHIFQGNDLGIKRVTWKRCMDMNDRQLRFITSGQGGEKNGVEREDGFNITVASEVMAIFCLAHNFNDLIRRLGNIIIGYNDQEQPIYARDLKAEGAMAALLKDAFNPNLVQTLEGTPAIIHGGPFANIAHGCNSVVATMLGLSRAGYVVTEAGFGADLGAEKFLDIKCQELGRYPDVIVLVVTTKALKYNGGVAKEDVKLPNLEALKAGICNLQAHVTNLMSYNTPVVVAINKYNTDVDEEIEYIKKNIKTYCEVCESFARGGDGAIDLAKTVVKAASHERTPTDTWPYLPYLPSEHIRVKLDKLARNVYHATGVEYSEEALEMMKKLEEMDYERYPVCVAKTQYSFSDNAKLLGDPRDHVLYVRELRLCAGAEFVVAICGNIMTMPGLPKVPAAESITVVDGKIVGLF